MTDVSRLTLHQNTYIKYIAYEPVASPCIACNGTIYHMPYCTSDFTLALYLLDHLCCRKKDGKMPKKYLVHCFLAYVGNIQIHHCVCQTSSQVVLKRQVVDTLRKNLNIILKICTFYRLFFLRIP